MLRIYDVAKINHYRPSLRYSDNQAKILREISIKLASSSAGLPGEIGSSPKLPKASQTAVGAYLAAVDAELIAFSGVIETLLAKPKTREAASAKLDAARTIRDQTCAAVVVGLYTLETAEERKELGRWLMWFAQRLPWLAEESVLPSMQRVSNAFDSRQK